jgi:hypothetical protein
MLDHACANHIQIDVDQTSMKVGVGLNEGGVIAVFPERTVTAFPLVVFLSRAAGD